MAIPQGMLTEDQQQEIAMELAVQWSLVGNTPVAANKIKRQTIERIAGELLVWGKFQIFRDKLQNKTAHLG